MARLRNTLILSLGLLAATLLSGGSFVDGTSTAVFTAPKAMTLVRTTPTVSVGTAPRYKPTTQQSKPLTQVTTPVIKPLTRGTQRVPPQPYTQLWWEFRNEFIYQFRKALMDEVKDQLQEILFQTFEQWLNAIFAPTTAVPVVAMATSPVKDVAPPPACTANQLAMLSPTKWVDVKACASYSKYDFMSGNAPTATQQNKLCDAGCSKMLDRVVDTTIPFCVVNLDDMTVDFMTALLVMFAECTDIAVQGGGDAPTPTTTAPTKTTAKPTMTPAPVATTATATQKTETTESPVTTPAPPTTQKTVSTPSVAKTSGAHASPMSLQAVTFVVMTVVAAVLA